MRIKFENETPINYDIYTNTLTFEKSTSLKSIHSGIIDYNNFPQSLSFNGVEIEIKEVYSNVLVMAEKYNEGIKYIYIVEEDKCYKIG